MGEGDNGYTPSLLAGLNPAQREAASWIEGPVLILAGPGSGKTRVLTHRIAHMISEAQPKVDPHSILAVTFTNKAAREMRERLDKLIEKQFGEGTDTAKRLTVGTFHSVCVRILRVEAPNIGLDRNFTIYDDSEQISLIKGAMAAIGVSDKQYNPRAALSLISSAKSTLLSPAGMQQSARSYWEEVVARIYTRYQELLRMNHALDFDDLINTTVQLFNERTDVLDRYQERYRYIMVDEYQDTNQAQYRLISLLASKYKNLCVVGDENQSIYGWRSADIRNILEFESDYPEAKVIALEQNYRSTQVILDAATGLIQANRQRKEKKLWTENGVGKAIQVFEAYNEVEEANYVANEIERLKARNEITQFNQVAILYRTNAQSRALEEMFVRRGLPYQLIGGTRFYERKEIKDVLAYLRLINNPYDGMSFGRLMNNTPSGKGIGPKSLTDLSVWASGMELPIYVGLQLLQSAEADELARKRGETNPEDGFADTEMLPPINLPAKVRASLFDFVNLLDGFIMAKKNNEMSLPPFIDYVLKKTGYEEFVRDGSQDGDERWANIQELRNVASEFAHLPLEEGLAAFLEDVSLVADVDKYDPQADAVVMITLHAAKGLEFPMVFIIGLEENILPHSRSLEKESDLEEERRLLYVGITRAMQRLYLVYAFRRTVFGNPTPNKPSRFLAEIPQNLIRGREQKAASVSSSGQLGMFGASATKWGSSTSSTRSSSSGSSRLGLGASRPGTTGSSRTGGATTPGALQFKAGDRVMHAKFGKGMVVSSKASGSDEEVTVAFDGQGIKRLMVSFANLQKL
ncbi:MAG TPA: UvrD-helicase domain-containing protein [Chloroflexia bacterium]|nr:UvrD-helicase domain-containing protein [Chloroflexia bacterium]